MLMPRTPAGVGHDFSLIHEALGIRCYLRGGTANLGGRSGMGWRRIGLRPTRVIPPVSRTSFGRIDAAAAAQTVAG